MTSHNGFHATIFIPDMKNMENAVGKTINSQHITDIVSTGYLRIIMNIEKVCVHEEST